MGGEIRTEVVRLNRSMTDAWRRGDAAAIAAHYSDNARIIGPRGQVVEGKENIVRYWREFPMQGREWTLDVLDAGGTANLVYQFGRSTIAGSQRSQVTDFVGVWERQLNGELKLAIDYWVPSRK